MNHCLLKGMSQGQIGDMDNPAEIFAPIRHSFFNRLWARRERHRLVSDLLSRTCPYLYLIALSTMSGNFTIVITETRRPGIGSTKNSMNLYRTSGIVVMTIAEIQSPMIRITISNLLGGFDLVVIRLYIQIIFFGTIGISTRTLISRIFTLHLCP